MDSTVEIYLSGYELLPSGNFAGVSFRGESHIYLPTGSTVTSTDYPAMSVLRLSIQYVPHYVTVLKDEYKDDIGYRQAMAFNLPLPSFVLDRLLVERQYTYQIDSILDMTKVDAIIINRLVNDYESVFYLTPNSTPTRTAES